MADAVMWIETQEDSPQEQLLADYLSNNNYNWCNPEAGVFMLLRIEPEQYSRLWIELLRLGYQENVDFWWE